MEENKNIQEMTENNVEAQTNGKAPQENNADQPKVRISYIFIRTLFFSYKKAYSVWVVF